MQPRCVVTLQDFLQDHRDDLVVIMAGYTKEMDSMMATNPGVLIITPHRSLRSKLFPLAGYHSCTIRATGPALIPSPRVAVGEVSVPYCAHLS